MKRRQLAPRSLVTSALLLLLAIQPASSWAMLARPSQEEAKPQAQGAEANIEFLNPSSFARVTQTLPGEESDAYRVSRAQAADDGFLLVAWVANPPPSPVVEFELLGAGNPQTLGTGKGVTPDTYEYLWKLGATPAPGRYTLKVTLYSAGQEVDSDTVRISVESDALTDILAAPGAVDLVSPRNGDVLGMFTPANENPGFTMRAVGSPQATSARYYFTTSPPGTEPIWTLCTTASLASATRVGCTSAQGPPTAVAAVGVGSRRVGLLSTELSGSAHRVLPYLQAPVSLKAQQTSQVVAPAGTSYPCATIDLSVTDQIGAPVWRATLHAHATGPSDQLKFQTGGFRAPPGHISESGTNCTGDAGSQGDHNVPGAPDTKHVESVAGTSPEGRLTLGLRSSDGTPGLTELLAWVDVNDDDDYSADLEPSSSATVTWAAAPLPQPTEPPPTPTPSATRMPSPGPISSASPEETPSPGGAPPTASPSPTPAPSPIEAPRQEARIEADRHRVGFRGTVNLRGVIIGSVPAACVSGRVVELSARNIGGEPTFIERATTVTDHDGAFAFSMRLKRGMEFIVRVTATEACSELTTAPLPVLVRPLLELDRLGDRHLRARLRPCLRSTIRTRVLLEAGHGRQWLAAASKRLSKRCEATFFVRPDRPYRARWPSQAEGFTQTTSRRVR